MLRVHAHVLEDIISQRWLNGQVQIFPVFLSLPLPSSVSPSPSPSLSQIHARGSLLTPARCQKQDWQVLSTS